MAATTLTYSSKGQCACVCCSTCIFRTPSVAFSKRWWQDVATFLQMAPVSRRHQTIHFSKQPWKVIPYILFIAAAGGVGGAWSFVPGDGWRSVAQSYRVSERSGLMTEDAPRRWRRRPWVNIIADTVASQQHRINIAQPPSTDKNNNNMRYVNDSMFFVPLS